MIDGEAESSALVTIDRAILSARQNRPVLAMGDRASQLALVQAAEHLDEAMLARAWECGDVPPLLAITARRAQSLFERPFTQDADVVTIALDRSHSWESVRALMDPLTTSGSTEALHDFEPAERGSVAWAAVEVMKLAQLLPAAILSPLRSPPPAAALAPGSLVQVLVQARDLLNYQARLAESLTIVAEARVPLLDAEDARLISFRPSAGGAEHLAVVVGPSCSDRATLVRLHSSCLTGDFLGSLRCDCGEQLRGAIRAICDAGGGILLYLSQEGRSIGLVNKLRAYRLQDQGADTIDANEQLGFEADERVYQTAAEMLRLLDVSVVRLMTNNPAKIAALESHGILVSERVPHAFPANSHNADYLATKAMRSGHLLTDASFAMTHDRGSEVGDPAATITGAAGLSVEGARECLAMVRLC